MNIYGASLLTAGCNYWRDGGLAPGSGARWVCIVTQLSHHPHWRRYGDYEETISMDGGIKEFEQALHRIPMSAVGFQHCTYCQRPFYVHFQNSENWNTISKITQQSFTCLQPLSFQDAASLAVHFMGRCSKTIDSILVTMSSSRTAGTVAVFCKYNSAVSLQIWNCWPFSPHVYLAFRRLVRIYGSVQKVPLLKEGLGGWSYNLGVCLDLQVGGLGGHWWIGIVRLRWVGWERGSLSTNSTNN